MRPPNQMEVTICYKNQVTASQSIATTTASPSILDDYPTHKYWTNAAIMNSNALYIHDQASGASTPEPIPMLQEYLTLWSRALVTKAKYKVTFIALSANTLPVHGFILFLPPNISTTQEIKWAAMDNAICSGANQAWSKCVLVGMPNLPQGQTHLEFGKYLGAVHGMPSAYEASMQQTSGGAGTIGAAGGEPDYSQPLPASGALTANPNSVINCLIGVNALVRPDGSSNSTAQGCSVVIQAELTVKFFRSGIMV